MTDQEAVHRRRRFGDPDAVRAWITYWIVLTALGLFSVALFIGDAGDGRMEAVQTFFLTLLGVVLGFYFGRQGVEQATNLARMSDIQWQKAKALVGQTDDLEKQVEHGQEMVKALTAFIQENPQVKKAYVAWRQQSGE